MPDDAIERAHWSRQSIAGIVIQAIVASRSGKGMALPAGRAADEILTLLAPAFASQQAPEGWMPIDTAPKDGTSVLVTVASTAANTTYGEGGYRHVIQSAFEDDLYWLGYDCHQLENACWKVTHWQPLPDPAMLDAAPSVTLGEGSLI